MKDVQEKYKMNGHDHQQHKKINDFIEFGENILVISSDLKSKNKSSFSVSAL